MNRRREGAPRRKKKRDGKINCGPLTGYDIRDVRRALYWRVALHGFADRHHLFRVPPEASFHKQLTVICLKMNPIEAIAYALQERK